MYYWIHTSSLDGLFLMILPSNTSYKMANYAQILFDILQILRCNTQNNTRKKGLQQKKS